MNALTVVFVAAALTGCVGVREDNETYAGLKSKIEEIHGSLVRSKAEAQGLPYGPHQSEVIRMYDQARRDAIRMFSGHVNDMTRRGHLRLEESRDLMARIRAFPGPYHSAF